MKITKQQFDSLPVVGGIKQCPSGDYSLISSFGERCSFGEGCSFGERCSFGKECSFEGNHKYVGNYPYWKFGGFGSRTGSELYVYNFKSGLHVRAGCWFGTIEDFRQRVLDKYSEEHEYIDIINLCKKKFIKRSSHEYI